MQKRKEATCKKKQAGRLRREAKLETAAHRAPRRIESNKGGPSIATNALRRSVAELSTDTLTLPMEINGWTDLSEVEISQANNVRQRDGHAVSSGMAAVPTVSEAASIPGTSRYRPDRFCKSREVGRTREAHAVRVETLNHACPLALPSRASEEHDSCSPASNVSQCRDLVGSSTRFHVNSYSSCMQNVECT
jgi:hypothetical protein